jgi:type IV pilus assembly protein PilM
MLKGKLDVVSDAFSALLRPKAQPLIGVDISSSSVKFVELEDAGRGRYRIERYIIEPLAKDAVVDGNIMNLDDVSDSFKRGWKKLNSRVRNVALALPTAAVITKKISVPAGQREEELELQVETEANQYIPFALEEVNLDFQVLGPSPTIPDDIEVLIAASRKEKVEDRVAAAEAAGLKAIVVDIESHATEAAFDLIAKGLPDGGRDQTIAIVDVGTNLMTVAILRNGESIYQREQPFGGQQLTQEIQRHFGLTVEEAEIAKRNGGLPENYEMEVLQPFMDNLALEVARVLQFFFTSTQYTSVDRLLLAGGCAAIPDLDAAVSRRTQVPTVVANPFSGMDVSPKIRPRQLQIDAPSLMIACGLALRRFDPA